MSRIANFVAGIAAKCRIPTSPKAWDGSQLPPEHCDLSPIPLPARGRQKIALPTQRFTVSAACAAAALFLVCNSAFAISGTWSGSLSNESGDVEQVTFYFSSGGRLILEFEARSGSRQVELTQVGQREQWLLPGSGFSRGEVTHLSVGANRVQARVVVYSEGNIAADRMFQTESVLNYDFVQQGTRVTAQVQIASQTVNTGGGVGMTSSQSRSLWRGQLRPE